MLDYTIKWKYNKESTFTSAFLKEMKNQWWWWFKISDLARTMKPFDTFFINKDWVYFCEVKMIDDDTFDIMQLRTNQFTALERISLLVEKYDLKNIHTIVLIYSIKKNKYISLNFKLILNCFNQGKTKIQIF